MTVQTFFRRFAAGGALMLLAAIAIVHRGTTAEGRTSNAALLDQYLAAVHDHGAVPTTLRECEFEPADMNGAFPERFYSTTNYRTQVRLHGEWIDGIPSRVFVAFGCDSASAGAEE